MLLIFSHCLNDADVNFTEIVERIMNNYSIRDYIYVITTNNASANSIF